MDIRNELIVTAPIFLLTATQKCSLCGNDNLVASLATLNLLDPNDEDSVQQIDDEGFMLSYIKALPDELLVIFLKRHPNYRFEYSSTAEADYYMSVCECGGHYGDHYVHKKISDMAFLHPDTLKVEKLPVEGSWVIPCNFTSSNCIGNMLKIHP